MLLLKFRIRLLKILCFFLPCFEKSEVFGYIGKKTQCNAAQTYDSHVSMLDR